MREHVGPIERLSHACAARRRLWVLCKRCGHAQRLDPRHLILLAGDCALRDLQRRLTCRRCSARAGHIVPEDEEWPSRR